MFLGEYEYKIDSKGRLPLPPKFRQELGAELILTRGAEKCIILYPLAEWHKLAESLTSKNLRPSKLRKLNRYMFGSAFNLTIDGQGRIALPSLLRTHAGIEDTAIIVGENNCIEIWSPILWNEEKTSAEEQVWQIIESLEDQQ